MTTNLALEYIGRRMCELCHGDEYHIRFRHFVLQSAEERAIPAYGQLFILIEPPANLRVESDTGMFDTNYGSANELQYEHQGEIFIANLSPVILHVQFIQVIPKK